jgi:hypothetical protein
MINQRLENNILLDRRGQYSIEYILILGVAILISFSFLPMVNDFNELTTCMATARNGALLGAEMDSFGYYPGEKFEKYMEEHPRLESCSKVVFIRIEYRKKGYDPVYKKTKVQLTIFASAPSIKYARDRNCAGDRINYYARKSICEAFKTEKQTNIYYNPAFSDRYYFTTCEVVWV